MKQLHTKSDPEVLLSNKIQCLRIAFFLNRLYSFFYCFILPVSKYRRRAMLSYFSPGSFEKSRTELFASKRSIVSLCLIAVIFCILSIFRVSFLYHLNQISFIMIYFYEKTIYIYEKSFPHKSKSRSAHTQSGSCFWLYTFFMLLLSSAPCCGQAFL